MLFGRDPKMAIAPSAQVAEFLDFGMRVLHVIFHGEARGIVYTNVAPKTPENPRNLEGQKFRI